MNIVRAMLYLTGATCFTTLAWHAWRRPSIFGDDARRRLVGRWGHTIGAVCMWICLALVLVQHLDTT